MAIYFEIHVNYNWSLFYRWLEISGCDYKNCSANSRCVQVEGANYTYCSCNQGYERDINATEHTCNREWDVFCELNIFYCIYKHKRIGYKFWQLKQ